MRYGIRDDLTPAIRCYRHRERAGGGGKEGGGCERSLPCTRQASWVERWWHIIIFSEPFDCVAANNPGLSYAS
jgi:hypothetical protein